MIEPTKIELGRPARPGQLILERRFRLACELIPAINRTNWMLDLGCGNGAQTVYFKAVARNILGLDVVPIDRAESSVGVGAFDFVRSDASALPVKNGLFDLVTAFEVLEHFPDDSAAVGEVARSLKPDGYFLFSVPNKWWLFESHGADVPGFNWLPWNRIPFVGWLPEVLHGKIARARIYTMKRARKLVTDHGFSVVNSGYVTAPLDVLPEGIIRRFFRATLFKGDSTSNPFLAVNLFVLCRKQELK